MMPATALHRQVFTTSRDLDFVGQRELAAQIGYPPEVWREVAVKELADNALDAAEDAGLAPRIEIGWDADAGSVSVTDHGPGLPPEVVTRIADFATRTSSREAYVGISRGAQGNAWMTLIAMPFALGGGEVTIDSHGHHHRLVMRPDPLTLKIRVEHHQRPGLVKNGTSVELVSATGSAIPTRGFHKLPPILRPSTRTRASCSGARSGASPSPSRSRTGPANG